MAINRRFLYAGLFLVALGGVLVAVDMTAVDTTALSSALRLWPIALIALGLGIVLRRSRYAVVAGIVGAMLPGLVLGGGLAIAPRHGLDCAAGELGSQPTTQSGSGVGALQIDTSCGSISIATRPGDTWELASSSSAAREPDVELQGDMLQIASTGANLFENGRDTWNLGLPTSRLGFVRVNVDAGRATADLAGADIEQLILTGNGASMIVDASTASIGQLNGSVDFGWIRIHLPQQGEYTGSFRVNAGDLRLCQPFGLGLRVDFAGSPREVRVNGLRFEGSTWQSELYETAVTRAELSVKVNFGSVEINPIGGCS
jgi:hypothetical protein